MMVTDDEKYIGYIERTRLNRASVRLWKSKITGIYYREDAHRNLYELYIDSNNRQVYEKLFDIAINRRYRNRK